MKKDASFLLILAFILHGCGHDINLTEQNKSAMPCEADYAKCEPGRVYRLKSMKDMDTLVARCGNYVRGNTIYYGLKIIRDERTYDSLIWCYYLNNNQPAKKLPPPIDFCAYNLIAGWVPGADGEYLDSVILRADCPDYFLKFIIREAAAGLTIGYAIDFIYVVPVLPDSLTVNLYCEYYDYHGEPRDQLNFRDTYTEY